MNKPKFILATMLLSGSSQVLAAPAPVSEVGSQSNLSATAFETRLHTLERMVANRNLQFLELQQQLESLQDEVSQLRGITEEQGYQLEKVLQRQRELYQEIENRVSSSNKTPVTVAPTDPSEIGDAADTATVSNDLNENDAYERAVRLIMQDKRYDAAIPEFKAFLDNYPNSVYVPNAHYWLGQLLIIKNDVQGAQSHFESVVNGFPDSNKRSDAMFKLANTYIANDELARAKTMLNNLIEDYPDSTSAKLAVEKLASLN